ncbi:unnamed protein product [marine sediment metagenome]|uniref:Uncharacterized protein n=1 Tax=marine sediment metagenome TaxID=412755 RepID=X1C400_9ZZZZ
MDREKIMRQWDYWRKRIADGDKSSAPRDWFESVLDSECEHEFYEMDGYRHCYKCGQGYPIKENNHE